VLICSSDHATQTETLEALIHAVEDNRLPPARVDDALRRQLRTKERFLATRIRSRPLRGRALREALGGDEHQAVADQMAQFL
jgi:hypothetical protein